MKFTGDSLYSDPETASRRLVEHAQAFEPIQDNPIYIEKINGPFLFGDGHTGGIQRRSQIRDREGLAELHESGTFVKFTPAGADLFA
jgi:hypothetical protein